MLWMITDFSRHQNFQDRLTAIRWVADCDVSLFSLRNEGVISNKELADMSNMLKKLYPEALFFLPFNTTDKILLKENPIHLKSSEIRNLRNIKKDFPASKIAISTHSQKDKEIAFESGADYVFYSPIYPPFSKKNDTRKTILPLKEKNLYLLGGINKIRATYLIEKGYTNLAGISLFYGVNASKNITCLQEKINEVYNDTTNTN